jgi:hypothetical protein
VDLIILTCERPCEGKGKRAIPLKNPVGPAGAKLVYVHTPQAVPQFIINTDT